MDQRGSLPNLVVPSPYGDSFSSALRTLPHHLRRLDLRVLADSTLFWPGGPAAATPFWPNLESLHVCFHNASPAGRWYFQGPEGEGAHTSPYEVTSDMYPPLTDSTEDIEWDLWCTERGYREEDGNYASFRIVPHEGILTPFLTAFAKAAVQMKRLKKCMLWTPMDWDPDDALEVDHDQYVSEVTSVPLAWGIAYVAPGARRFRTVRSDVWTHPGEEISTSRQMWWKTAKWRPGRELHGLFQRIRESDGSELIEYWRDERYKNGLVEASVFCRCED